MVRDILLNDDGDLSIDGGDFVTGDSDAQHIEHLLLANKGEYRHNVYVGAGIRKNINAPEGVQERTKLLREIQVQAEVDGLSLISVDFDETNTPTINGEYL